MVEEVLKLLYILAVIGQPAQLLILLVLGADNRPAVPYDGPALFLLHPLHKGLLCTK